MEPSHFKLKYFCQILRRILAHPYYGLSMLIYCAIALVCWCAFKSMAVLRQSMALEILSKYAGMPYYGLRMLVCCARVLVCKVQHHLLAEAAGKKLRLARTLE